ncbi:NADH-quinone oxidoreductase subunit C, partial [Flavonifractor plautii]
MHKNEILINANEIRNTISKLKKDGYPLLLDITVIDYLEYPDVTPSRFAVVYILRDHTFKKFITVKAFVDDITLTVDSISDMYYSAN